jgi:glycosyltransferase involved in cell wall biosynthesis
MNICVITSAKFPPEEGIGNYIYNMSKEFIRKGHNVTVITRGGVHKTQKENFDGIELYGVPFILAYPFHVHIHGYFLKKLLKSIESNFDVIHVHTPLPPPIKSHVPILLTVHSPMLNGADAIDVTDIYSLATKFQAKFISYPIEKQLFRNSDMITTVSDRVRMELKEYGLNREEIIVIYNGVDQIFFSPMNKKTDEKYVLYTGRISYGKGLVELIECAYDVCKIHKDLHFILAGDGPLLPELQKKVQSLKLGNRIDFLGRVNRDVIKKLYQNATIFAFPSYYEGLPGSLLEAMSCKLPIVATNVAGNVELIKHNENGFLVPSKDSSALSKAILKLLDEPETREKFGENARRTIEEKFTWDAISDRILHCYESILQKRSSG